MYLKRIEMQGFKSFANKMVFEFHDGITGIVGPNGSGKSNVSDAVRWVLGEQSAKQLRGGNMQDVIFAGTEARKPQSFAAVSITFDNSDHSLDIGFEEVTVTRRLYRSGESEYKINNSAVRLRDIHELFYDTGIGKEGYSIIGQGQIERIISGKADERRELFDEAAGIVKFKRRKNMTLKKLDEEQANLVRVNDILTEIGGRLGPLKKQSEVAKIYLDKRETLRDLDVNLFLIDNERIGRELEEITGKAKIADDQMAGVNAELENAKEEYLRLDEEITGLDGQIAELSERNSKNQLTRQQLKGQIDLLNEQIHAARQSSEHYLGRRNAIGEERERKKAERVDLYKQLSELEGTLVARRKALNHEEEELRKIDEKIFALNDEIGRARNDMIGVLNGRTNVKGRMQRYDAMLEQISIRKSELDNRMLRFAEEEAEAKEKKRKAEENLKSIRDHMAALRDESAALEGRVADLQSQIRDENERLDGLQQDFHRNSSRLESLRTINEHYEGYGNAIKKVMEQKGRNPGILGVVADLISTEKKYEVAIETALGGSIRNIVTDNETTAKYLIEFLKMNHYGRATFLPLTNMKARKAFDRKDVLGEIGVVGVAEDLVTCADAYMDMKRQLLGRTIVVDNIDNAIRIGRKYGHSLYMVTLAGESFSPGGSITGGAFRNKENLLGRKREIEELETSVKSLKKAMEASTTLIDEKREERNRLRDEIVRIGGKIHGESIRENTSEMSRKQADDQIRMNHIDRGALDRESVEIEKQIGKIHASSASIEKELAASEEEEGKLTQRVGRLEEEEEELRKERESQAGIAENLRMEVASLEQNRGFIKTNSDRLKSELVSLDEEDKGITESLAAGKAEVEEKQAYIETIKGTIKAAEAESLEDADKISGLQKQREELSHLHKKSFLKRDELSDTLSKLDKESFRLHSQKEKMEESLENSITHLWEEYELTPNQAKKYRNEEHTDRKEIRRQLLKVRDEIKKLGHVNVNSIEEYKELSERHTFMSGQHTDLVESTKTLMGIISELDAGMRRQFNEKFEEINREFDKTFQALFGGGKGKLEIDREADVLDAVITIIAEPPGKKLQNMMQLSGGEKALTAIALLFAIQNMKPSPFALLDEIEAALDDNNVSRFAEYLHKLTRNTQFIVITHRRGTMVACDRLYGITMQEKGISTMVSVNLIEDKLSS
ncbi:MAG: chromosome segregation protein SMC [Lachnospiraceae bacterium]|nr:chromosome segregation protein SMC [Lachnospiraceae bacterium]